MSMSCAVGMVADSLLGFFVLWALVHSGLLINFWPHLHTLIQSIDDVSLTPTTTDNNPI